MAGCLNLWLRLSMIGGLCLMRLVCLPMPGGSVSCLPGCGRIHYPQAVGSSLTRPTYVTISV